MIAGKDYRLFLVLAPLKGFAVLKLQMHEPGDDVQQGIGLQNLLPQIGGGILVFIFGDVIACAAVFGAFVEW